MKTSPGCLSSVWLSESILRQHRQSACDVARADVYTLAALPVFLCALGDDKTTTLPISWGQSSHLATYFENKLKYSLFLASNFNYRIYCISYFVCTMKSNLPKIGFSFGVRAVVRAQGLTSRGKNITRKHSGTL